MESRNLSFLGYPNYDISKDGIITNIKLKRKVDGFVDKYIRVKLYDKGVGKRFSLHRLLALSFIPNPDNKPEIDHINRNPLDNSLNNLRWANDSEQEINKGCFKNNKTGIKNIHYLSKRKLYRVAIIRGDIKYERCFTKKEDAIEYRDIILHTF